MSWVDMAREPMGMDVPTSPEPYYPHAIHLTMEDLQKLGLEMVRAGTEFHIEAVGVVSHSSTSDPDADGDVDHVSCSLTITHLDAKFGDEPALKDTDGDRLYRSG